MDTASLYTRKIPQNLLSVNYTGVLSPNFFVEANFARRQFTFINSGSQFTDLIKGTLLLDRAARQPALPLADVLRRVRPREA